MNIDISEDYIAKLDKSLLETLLVDRSTKRRIVWATNDYIHLGDMFFPECEITADVISSRYSKIIRPRVTKGKEKQDNRTRNRAEVFTPSWVCNEQNNLIDERWFGRANVFNVSGDKVWITNTSKVVFPAKVGKTWQDYIRAKRMEITCGEAPYLVSRYDTVTGQEIADVNNRIGLLDRKIRIINENTDDENDWLEWVKKAYQSVYGYEYQGDNLFLARENLLFTFIDNMLYKFGREPSVKELQQIAYIISWNIWQMDGLKYTAPYSEVECQADEYQLTLFDDENVDISLKKAVPCVIRDWTNKCYVEYQSLVGRKG